MADDGAGQRHLAVFGGYGVVGTGIVSRLLDQPRWRMTTIGRTAAPARLIDGRSPPRHLQADLLDAVKTRTALASLSDVTDMIFCAYVERDTMAATVAPNVAMLAHALDALEAACAPLRRVVLIGGGKSYGEHLGPYKTPAKERDPRHLGPIFYNDQEDLLRERAKGSGFEWTVLRPDGVLGPSIGSPMNMLMGVGAYAAICKELGIPLRFPGSPAAWSALHQATDAGVLASAVEWSLTTPSASGQIFNVTNGDNFRWQNVWPEIAAVFQVDVAPPQPMHLGEQMADKAGLWQRMVDRHGLLPIAWEKLAAWPFVDAWFHMSFDMVQSTIKIRQAGFNTCIDTHDALVTGLQKLRRHRVLP
ncbi:Nucleoside-diphosphate-sugar epimerase [Arboricoccus pini]|uniref:Nucleoside-diphosphate-sugar epimerase n=1 Tax=Arboricoccus pini TaxID=1963835 RepID=A0A212R8H4_9PROT|nr:SDR family oxidoreductase [Arboricoccus pini]SNB68484.1 Nucleoside-diphosphate-sugar epimerase [Arboricoccus pini]